MFHRLTVLAVAPLAAVALMAAPAAAEEHCHTTKKTEQQGSGVRLVQVCTPHSSGGSTTPAADRDGPVVTCTPWEADNEAEAVMRSGYEVRGDGSRWVGWPHNCSDGSRQMRWTCVANCPSGGAPTSEASIPGLRLEALARIDPPLPGMRNSFDLPAANGDVRAVVLAETWWWTEAPFEPVTAKAEDGPLWVEVTATPQTMTIDPGDGSPPIDCAAPGVVYNRHASYYDQIPGERRGACVHVYEQTFDQVTATMAVTWTVTWEGYSPLQGSVGGSLAPMVRRQQVSFPVREIQSVIVY